MKAKEKCKICKLEKDYPGAFEKINKAILDIEAGEKISMAQVIREVNDRYGLKLTPMNASRHKSHLGINGDTAQQNNKQQTGKVEVFSSSGQKLYDNIDEIIKNLKPEHKLFCEELVNTYNLNGTVAYQAVYGIDEPHVAGSAASRLLGNVNVSVYASYLMDQRSQNLGISSSFVLQGLLENYMRCMQATPVYDRRGNKTGEYSYNPQAANRALELIGKHLNMFDKNAAGAMSGQMAEELIQKMVSNQITPVMALMEIAKSNLPHQDILKVLLKQADLTQLTDGPKREEDDLKKASTEELNERLQRIAAEKQKLLSCS